MSSNVLENLVRESGEDWLIDSFAPSHEAIASLLSLLEKANETARTRLSSRAPVIDPATLEAERQRNPHKVKAFLQAMGATSSPEMLLMVWRILMGCSIQRVQMQYELKNEFTLRVTLETDDATGTEVYCSNSIDDAALLRHFGIMTMGGEPIFDGFYPM